MTPQEAASRAAQVLAKAEAVADAPYGHHTADTVRVLAAVADSWTRLGEALAQNPIMVLRPERES
jgi:hypothetical protein